jgi:hypothetical protein
MMSVEAVFSSGGVDTAHISKYNGVGYRTGGCMRFILVVGGIIFDIR